MKTLEEYIKFVDDIVVNLDYSKCRPASLFVPIAYTLKGGGKRMRPMLFAAFADALGGDITHLKGTISAIEMFHNFTLIHDDIMDKSSFRHGRPTVWKKWGESTAILAGDTMLSIANTLVGDKKYLPQDIQADLYSSFNITAVKVYRGQQYDMDYDSLDNVTVEEYTMMIGLKTAALIGAACHMGVIAAGGDNESRNAAYEYGYKLGLAFQLQDDLLDTFGDQTTFGKPIGGDIVNNKKTWLNIMATTEAPERMAEASKLEGEDKIKAVSAIYSDLNLPSRCNQLIDCYLSQAIEHLGKVKISDEAEKFFIDFAQKLAGRKK